MTKPQIEDSVLQRLIIKKGHILCTRCGMSEPVHPGEGTSALKFIQGITRLAGIHALCVHPNFRRNAYSRRVCRSSIAGGSDIGRVYCCRPSGHRGWHRCTEDGRGPQWQTPTRHYVVVRQGGSSRKKR